MNTQARIIVRTEFFAKHRWNQAPDRRAYLRVPHAHAFRVQLEVAVTHDDRDVEFHDLREWLDDRIRQSIKPEGLVVPGPPAIETWSCETWAGVIIKQAQVEGYNAIACEVWEDHAFGARVELEP
jgi:hypothetical protein